MTKPKAIIYCRVSSSEQRIEGFSLDAQLTYLRDYCASNNLEIFSEVLESQSAKSTGRRLFAKVLTDIKNGNATHLVVEKLDRLTRNLRDLADVEDLVQSGMTLHLVKDGQPITANSRSQDRFILGIKAVIAKNYSDNLSEEIRKGMIEKARQGYWPTLAPTGYQNSNVGGRRIIQPDPDQAPKMLELFRAYATGEFSLEALTRLAKQLGLKSSQGGPLSRSRIHTLLKHRIYIGIVDWRGKSVQGQHEPIIPVDLFNKVQAVASGKNSPKSIAKTEFMFRGLIRCQNCGCLCSPYASRGIVYYACSGAKGCSRRGMREDAICAQVADQFSGAAIPKETLDFLVESIRQSHGSQRDEVESQRQVLNRERTRTLNKLERLLEERLDNEILTSAYDQLQTKLTLHLTEINDRLAQIDKANVASWVDQATLVQSLSNLPQNFNSASNSDKRKLVRLALSNMELNEGKLTITDKPWFKLLKECLIHDNEIPVKHGISEKWSKWLDDILAEVA